MRIQRSLSLATGSLLSLGIAFAFLASSSANPKNPRNITFSKDIAPIFNKNCAECHRPGESAPFSTLAYKEVRPWAKSIKEKVSNRTMPPWHADPHYGVFKNDRTLTQKEIDTIVAWVEAGAPEGSAKDLPPIPTFTEGWDMPTPDLVIQIPEEYTYKPGADEYQYFDVDPGFKEDKYIVMAEARPGNRKIVHHIIAFLVPPGTPNMSKISGDARNKMMEQAIKNSPFYRDGYLMRIKPDQPVVDDGCSDPKMQRSGNDNMLVAFAPGKLADKYPAGVVRRIPAGSVIRFQMHYSNQTLQGDAPEKDRSLIGLIFAKDDQVTPETKLMTTNSVGNIMFKVPAGAENHRVTACRTVKRDTTIYGMTPHMHMRGKSMEYKVFYPDGKSEVLLSVPKWDFGWQTDYLLKEPKRLPAGSKLMVTAYFDNSSRNKFNPDPTKDIRYGEPTYDEMMLGFMDYVSEMPAIAKVDPKILDSYTGKYEVSPNIFATVTRQGNSLIVQIPMRQKMEFLPMSDTKFFLKYSDTDLSIVKNDKGEVVEALIGNTTAKKVREEAASVGQ
jgi:hypothetical protein